MVDVKNEKNLYASARKQADLPVTWDAPFTGASVGGNQSTSANWITYSPTTTSTTYSANTLLTGGQQQ